MSKNGKKAKKVKLVWLEQSEEALNSSTNHLLSTFYRYVAQGYGPECSEHEPGCPVCDMWAKYHDLKAYVE